VPPVNYESVPPPLERVEESGLLVRAQRVAAVIGLSVAPAIACTLPAGLRVSATLGGPAPIVRAWAALAASALPPMIVSVCLLRRARQGLRAFAEPAAGLRAFGVGLWLSALLITLSLFGAVLRATTHHRALAGVTFASGAVLLAVGYALVCTRIVALLRDASDRVRRAGVALLGGVAVVTVASLATRFVRVLSSDPSSSTAAATVVDVLCFTLCAVAASVDRVAARRTLALAGTPVAFFLAALGLTTLQDPPVRQAIDEQAPALAPVADLVSGR
jgi:hypothetical protein